MSTSLLRNLNALAGLGIAGILAFALIWQIVLAELPCPLCLLQRLAFVAIGFGICLNIAGGLRPSHFGVILLGALFGVLTSSRQVLLHIVPGTGHYGAPFLGLHFYSWALILFLAVILLVALVLFLFGGAIAEALDDVGMLAGEADAVRVLEADRIRGVVREDGEAVAGDVVGRGLVGHQAEALEHGGAVGVHPLAGEALGGLRVGLEEKDAASALGVAGGGGAAGGAGADHDDVVALGDLAHGSSVARARRRRWKERRLVSVAAKPGWIPGHSSAAGGYQGVGATRRTIRRAETERG